MYCVFTGEGGYMKTAIALVLCAIIITLCAGPLPARESGKSRRALMRPLSGEELVDPRLEGDEMREFLTSAEVDTYCIVWYDFEEMDWQGWTRVDNTEQVDTFFHVDDFSGLGGGVKGGLVPLEGTKSMWCGLRDWDHQIPGCPGSYAYLCSWAAAPGYGDKWDQALGWVIVHYTCPLVVSYKLRCDTEPDYDYVTFEGQNVAPGCYDEVLARYEGEVDTVATHTLYLATVNCKLRFHFVSDGAWSDQDGLWDTDGGAIVDSITISHAGGLWDYEDFESYDVCVSDTRPYGGKWHGDVGSPYGQYAGLYGDLFVDKDPCNDNFTTQIVFFIGSPHPSDEYPGLYETPFCHGFAHTTPPCQDEMVVSPVIDLTKYSTECNEFQDAVIPTGELPDLGGHILRFTAYHDLPHQNLVFYQWHVRSIDPSGCPGLWLDRDYVYYSTDGYVQQEQVIGDLVSSDSIQVALRCIDMAGVWYYLYMVIDDHTPAPWFDNVRLYRYEDRGPQWSYRQIDLFQDNFPELEFNLESYIRADAAIDIRPEIDPVIEPGDSIVISCNSREGIDTMPDGRPKVFMHVRCGYIGDPYSPKPVLYGPALEGTYGTYHSDDGSEWTVMQGDYAMNGTGEPVEDRFMFDLNDSLFTRGYRIDYYFEGYDLDGESSTLPQHPNDETYFEWTCLPTLAADILYVDDYNRGAPPKGITQVYWDDAFGHLLWEQPDRYDVNSASSAASNGLGSRAKMYHLTTAYDIVIWDSGDLEDCTISEGTGYSDKSNDAQMLVDWMEFAEHDVGLWICGDDIAEELDDAPSAIALQLMVTYCGVVFTGGDYHDLSGIVSPLVHADLNVGNPLWHSSWGDSFYTFGGCPNINRFDYLEKAGSGEYALDYPDIGGMPYYAGIYNNGINSSGFSIRTMWFGFSMMYMREAEIGAPMMREQVVRDVIYWMEYPVWYMETEEIPLATKLSQNYPNPFNPVTTIKFGLKEKGHVSLRIYDVAGRLVRTLVDEVRKAGSYEELWDGKNNRGTHVASGVYFYRFKTRDFEKTRKMVLLR
jgi:hypothetical protein